MDFPLVIKVKYGETLRRFTASVGANGLLELDMARLTVQIRVLFNFPPDADLTLTYIDEDNDEVTLVDDNDLYDATCRQKLNPLRIQVVKNMVRPARFESTCLSARVGLPRPPPTEVCSDSESSNDLLKEDDTKTVATKIRIMEAMSKMGETSDMGNFKSKSTANEKSKPTNALSEAGKLNPYIDKGKSKMEHLDDFTDPAIESSFMQSKPSDACIVEVDVDYEQMLLDTLERMGFKQVDLNKEVLRKNLFDLGQTITDLCDMGEWDEPLNELEQMGFCDKEMNVELLKKNEGIIEDAMTLISEETQ